MVINDNGVQVERQYIGARYVPKFFQGVNGSTEWAAGLQYEPLTIVTYLGNSFTSKVPVPAGVGNPADNPVYWANTGNFNPQLDRINQELNGVKQNIADIQTDVSGVKNDIVAINNKIDKFFIFIGDSYSSGFSTYNNGGVAKRMADFLRLDTSQYIISASGGGGLTVENETNRFIALLNNAISQLSDKSVVTDVILLGGINDANPTSGSIEQVGEALDLFVQTAKAINTHVQVWTGFINWGVNSTTLSPKAISIRNIWLNSSKYGANYLNNVHWVMYNPIYRTNDQLHPNNNGVDAIASACACAYHGGAVDIDMYRTTNITAEYFHNGVVTIVFSDMGNFPVVPNTSTYQVIFDTQYLQTYYLQNYPIMYLPNNEVGILAANIQIGYDGSAGSLPTDVKMALKSNVPTGTTLTTTYISMPRIVIDCANLNQR